MINIYCVSR